MNDDLILLASAYLDGDVTADERARVETDPELLAEVERLRAVQVLLGESEPTKISVREAHLAAALHVWDRLPDAERTAGGRDTTPADGAGAAAAASVMAPASLRDRRRRPAVSTRWLTGAAAALALVAVAGVGVRLVGTDSADDSADSAATESAESTDAASSAESAIASADDDGDAGVDTPESGDDTAAADESVQLDTGFDEPAPPPEDEALQQLLTVQDLADFAAPALAAPRAPDVPAATSAPVESELAPSAVGQELPLCLGADIVVGPALFGDTLVVVAVDEGRRLALAYQGESCTEIARAELDSP